MVVDEARDRSATSQVDGPGTGAGELCDLLAGSDRDDAIAFDGDSLSDREALVDGDDLAVGEEEIRCRTLCGGRHRRIWKTPAATHSMATIAPLERRRVIEASF